MLVSEPGAGAAQAADHLVDVQKDIVLAADLLDPRPVSLGRHDHPSACGDRLQHDGAHGVWAFAQDRFLDGVRRALPIVFHVPLGTVFQAMRHADEAVGIGAVLGGPLVLAAGRQRADGGAVIIAVTIQDLPLSAAMLPVGDLADHLVDLLVGLGPRVRVINPAHPRHLGDQPFCKQRRRDVARRPRIIVQLDQLVAHRIGNAFPTIAHVDRPHAARNRVQILAPVGVPKPHPLAFHEDTRVGGFIGFVLGQVMPDMGAVGRHHMGQVVLVQVKRHGIRSQEGCVRRIGRAGTGWTPRNQIPRKRQEKAAAGNGPRGRGLILAPLERSRPCQRNSTPRPRTRNTPPSNPPSRPRWTMRT